MRKSVHLGYEKWGLRFDLTKVKVDFPEAFEKAFYGTDKFDLISNINGFKIDYIGKRINWTKGAFVGLDINHQTLLFEHRNTEDFKKLTAFNIGLRVGYKVPVFKGFYITPWAAYWVNVGEEEFFKVKEDIVSTNKNDWLLTLHFGYAFKF